MPVTLITLTLRELRGLADDPARVRGIAIAADAMVPTFIVEGAISDLEAGLPERWHSLYALVAGAPARVVGSSGFKGAPKEGRVEIGYGVAEEHRGKGYATAAVLQMVAHAFADHTVTEVYAESAVINPASRRVVEKAGFRHAGLRETEEDGVVDCWVLGR